MESWLRRDSGGAVPPSLSKSDVKKVTVYGKMAAKRHRKAMLGIMRYHFRTYFNKLFMSYVWIITSSKPVEIVSVIDHST